MASYLYLYPKILDLHCSQPWPGSFLLVGSVCCRDSSLFQVLRIRDPEHSTVDAWPFQPFPAAVTGSISEERQKQCKEQRMRKSAIKCCLLNMTWLIHTRTPRSCGYLQKPCTWLSQLKNPIMDKEMNTIFPRHLKSYWKLTATVRGRAHFLLGSKY